MTITFVSNYINHHQIPFSKALYESLEDNYCFIQTMPMEEERVAMGWDKAIGKLPYVRYLYEEEEACIQKILDSDVVLLGWTGREDIAAKRLATGKMTFRVSERLYREGQWKAVSPRGLLAKYKEHLKFRKGNVYLLCAGAYVASDFHLIGAYPNKMFRWGYFPETKIYSDEEFMMLKRKAIVKKSPNVPRDAEKIQIVWAGRFMPLKHPEYAARLAKSLKEQGYIFTLHMLGSGEMEQELKAYVEENELSEDVIFYGFKEPGIVRSIMEKCHIHLFTSNHLEGWGAVVNEGMNSGCVEVVSASVGAAPYLIRHGINGLVYPNDSYSEMEKLVVDLLDHWDKRKGMGLEAYKTIRTEWNAEHAAQALLRFINQAERRTRTEARVIPAASGPLSIAPVISPGKMYKAMLEGRLDGESEEKNRLENQ